MLEFSSIIHPDIDDVLFVYLDVLVKAPNGPVIYKGILQHYELAKDGKLESLILTGPSRRAFLDDAGKDYYYIPSSLFVILSVDIININIRYAGLKKK